MGAFQLVTDVTLHVLFLGTLPSSNPAEMGFNGPFPPSAGKKQIYPVSILGTCMAARDISVPLLQGLSLSSSGASSKGSAGKGWGQGGLFQWLPLPSHKGSQCTL